MAHSGARQGVLINIVRSLDSTRSSSKPCKFQVWSAVTARPATRVVQVAHACARALYLHALSLSRRAPICRPCHNHQQTWIQAAAAARAAAAMLNCSCHPA